MLDVLNAEQELLNSQVQLVTARRDAYVAGFALLNAMGQAEIEDLNLEGGVLYDPVANYDRVARRASDCRGSAVTNGSAACQTSRSGSLASAVRQIPWLLRRFQRLREEACSPPAG